jgi:outer membrane receptor protein involved in Fe transport
LSGRYDRHDYWENLFSYKIEAATKGNTKVYVSYAQTHLLPSIYDYDSNHDIKPEDNGQYEVGVEGGLGFFSFKTSLFYSQIGDKIVGDRITWVSTNAGNGRNMGAEVYLGYNLRELRNYLIYNYSDYKIKPYGEGSFLDMNFAPAHMLRLHNVYIWQAWQFSSSIEWVSEQYTDYNKSGARLPAYVDWILSVERKIGQGVIFGGVRNVLDQHYAKNAQYDPWYPAGSQDLYYPNPGRTFYLGVRYKLFG